jgi:hypothetical protein
VATQRLLYTAFNQVVHVQFVVQPVTHYRGMQKQPVSGFATKQFVNHFFNKDKEIISLSLLIATN